MIGRKFSRQLKIYYFRSYFVRSEHPHDDQFFKGR